MSEPTLQAEMLALAERLEKSGAEWAQSVFPPDDVLVDTEVLGWAADAFTLAAALRVKAAPKDGEARR
jgi:hypothetical protein